MDNDGKVLKEVNWPINVVSGLGVVSWLERRLKVERVKVERGCVVRIDNRHTCDNWRQREHVCRFEEQIFMSK